MVYLISAIARCTLHAFMSLLNELKVAVGVEAFEFLGGRVGSGR